MTDLSTNPRALTLADILDLRAYEREREALRAQIVDIKALRRVHLGTIMSFIFESRDTMRFQVQEMARAEKMATDEQVQHELDVYNKLIPNPGELSCTMFIECTTDDQMRFWFPRLVGVEHTFEIRIGEAGPDQIIVRSTPEEDHQAQLTRDDITSAVHYIRFEIGIEHATRFLAGPVELACTHESYQENTQLSDGVRATLAADIRE
jgi:Protein of unknown function (DUF3501)